jgi:cyanophycinase
VPTQARRRASTRTRKTPVLAKAIPGTLIIIGGHEDKKEDMQILKEVASHAQTSRLVVTSMASELPDDMWADYQRVFKSLGVKDVKHLDIRSSEDARNPENLKILDGAQTVFFTGGDQLRITSKIGGTPIADRIHEIYRNGGTIAGTSAGASVMGETMLVGGENQESHKIGNWMMAPGMGFIQNMIIDQHFAQRGRIGRLLGAVSLNPGVLGIGIDENTSICIQGTTFKVIGQSAVYVVDGREVTFSNVSEAAAEQTMSMHNVKVHILSEGDGFDLKTRKPSHG